MSHTLELLAAPHGTIDGYRAGCRTKAACQSDPSCLVVHTRYVGDYSFSKRVDAGETPASIFAEEAAAAATTQAHDKVANRAARATEAREHRANEDRKRRHMGKPARRRQTIAETRGADIARLSAEGHPDRVIAEQLGIRLSTVGSVRRHLGITKPVPVKAERPAPTRKRLAAKVHELHAAGLTDQQIADELGSSRHYIGITRRRLGLPLNPARTNS